MSVACGEFAEHVWKPGSCKNCFHPRSAHVPAGSARVSTGSGPGEAEEGTVPFPPPHNKPTIAVRPTMMSNDNGDTTADLGVNPQQELRKMMDLGPLFIDGPTCRSTLLQSAVQGTLEYSGKFSPSAGSPPGFLSDTRVISNIYVTQGDGRVPHSLKENANGGYSPSGPGPRHLPSGGFGEVVAEVTAEVVRDPQAPLGVAIDIIATVPSNGVTVVTEQPSSACTSPVRTRGSRHASLSDSGSYGSSTGSLSGAEPFGLAPPLSPGTPATPTSPGSPLSDGQDRPRDAEPIYAESTKRKRRPPQQRTELNVGVNGSEGGQRATITMVAAHTEENNRTFYLSSPDSAVSSQWTHLSPSAAATPTFTWPAVPVATETASPKPQSSPPVPPKRTSRSPKLGASSLSPVPLPELSLPPAKATAAPPAASLTPGPHPERRHKLLSSGWSREGRIEEEEEEQEEADGEAQTRSPRRGSAGLVNGGSVWRGCKEGGTEPGEASAAATANNNGARQQQGRGSVSMLANANPKTERPAPPAQTAEHPSGTNTSHEPTPPPPPPKKHHRVSTKMNASSVDLDRGSQQGSVESLTQSVRGAASTSASTDSLHSDAGPQDSAQHSCPSPFPSSPLASSPGSPHPDPFPSNALARQVQPPPLPEKKLVNRTVSAPSEGGGRALVRGRPRLPFCGSEGNVNRPDAAGTPPGSAEPPHHHASDDSLRSRTLDEPQVKGRGRLLGQSRGAAASCSSPQLSVASATTPPRNGAGGSSLRLQSLLSNMDSRECVYSKLGGLYAESLRRLALKCEEHFTRGQRNTLRFDESSWSLFKLTCNKPSCLAGDAVYYSAACASDPSNTYAVKICKSQGPESRQQHLHGLAVQQTLPAHFSLQQECGHFIACVPQSMLPSEGPPGPATPPQAEHERVVVITRDVPWQTAADFVREWAEFHRAQPEAYERRVCFLLLQLCNGLEHLKGHGVTHRDLCLENLLLVPHRRDPVSPAGGADPRQQQLPRLLVSSFGKAKQRGGAPGDDPVANADPRLKRDHARLAPEIVSAAQYRKFDEFQTGILVYELLHQPNPFEVRPELREQEYRMEELPRLPCASLYSSGLQRLAHLLLQPDPIKRIHIQDAKRALQCLLWGPRQEMLDLPWSAGSAPGSGSSSGSRYEGLLNWLDVKRALLMMKFAERSLEPERTAELEDWLCCQYFSSAHPLALCHTAELLHGAKHTH